MMGLKEFGVVRNPVFALGWGLLPVIALTQRFDTAWITGVLSLFIVFMGGLTLNLLKDLFPFSTFWYARMLVLAFWVNFVEVLLGAYLLDVKEAMGIYLPLLVVNTFFLNVISPPVERKEQNKGAIALSFAYFLTISFMGGVREMLGLGSLTLLSLPGKTIKYTVLRPPLEPIRLLALPAGGLILYGYLKAGFRWLMLATPRNPKEEEKR